MPSCYPESNANSQILRAPVSERIGDRRVSPGNLVTGGTAGNTTLLATITSTDPIRSEFTVDEASYLRYLRLANGGAAVANRGIAMPVRLKLIDEPTFAFVLAVVFVFLVLAAQYESPTLPLAVSAWRQRTRS